MYQSYIILLILPTIVLSETCAGKTDGHYEISCRSYLECSGGTGTLHSCYNDGLGNFTVYNAKTGTCDNPTNVAPPCGRIEDCTGKADGRYPDVGRNCTSFYTCVAEKFDGHTFCPNGLTFDTTKQTCNWIANVAPPCGTLGVPVV